MAGLTLGVLVRCTWAVLAACAGAVWLLAWLRRPARGPGRSSRALWRLLLVVLVFWSVAWLVIALVRLPYPYELEWVGGAMLDQCKRVLAGLPLYVPPGPGWFPIEYPPLYTWLCAGVMRLTGGPSFAAMRSVSIASTVGCFALLWLWARRLLDDGGDADPAARRRAAGWAFVAAGLFLAAYRFTGAWYDIERLDALFMALSLLGGWLLDEGERPSRGRAPSLAFAAGAGVALSLAFVTKQQTILFILAGAGALLWRRRWAGLGAYTLACVGVAGGATAWLNASTHGWFGYYCFHVPAANGIEPGLVRLFVLGDLPLFAPCIAIACIGAACWRQIRREEMQTSLTTLIAFTVAALAGSLLSRVHWGGDQNVLIPAFTMLGLAAAVAAGRLSRAAPSVLAPVCALVLAQTVAVSYRPDAQVPTRAGRAAGAAYRAAVAEQQRQGDVLCPDHGGFTDPPHFHTMALHDVYNADKGLPADLVTALRSHRYAAVITDARPTPDGALAEVVRQYPVVRTLGLARSWVVTGFPTPGPGRAVWISLPAGSADVGLRSDGTATARRVGR